MDIRLPDVYGKWYTDRTPLRDYGFVHLEVDCDGNVLSPVDINKGGDTFVATNRLHDLSCLLKPLPPSTLRELAVSRYAEVDGCRILRPRSDRDDLLTLSRGSKRKACFYGANYILGRRPGEVVTVGDIDAFMTEYSQIMKGLELEVIRPSITNVAKTLQNKYVRPWFLISHEGIPKEVMELYMKFGRGANLDTTLLGASGLVEEKIDQKMSFLSVMARLDSPVPNLIKGIDWVNDGLYDPDDAYGIYIVDCHIDETFGDTPVYVVSGSSWVPVVGKMERVVVLKPTMDDLKLLESHGIVKNLVVHDSWRFRGRGKRPYRPLHDVMSGVKDLAVHTSTFFKLVACAPWGLTLNKYPTVDGDVPILRGSYWFNPVIGYTVTDLMRSINFRTKLYAQGRISAEVVDTLIGEVSGSSWYDKNVYRSKHTGTYVHLSPSFHVSEGDDKLHLLDALRECRKSSLVRKVRSRYSWGSMVAFDSDSAIRSWLFKERTTSVAISPYRSTKRVYKVDLSKVPLCEYLHTPFSGRPSIRDEVYNVQPIPEGASMIYELADDTLLEALLKEGSGGD